MAERSVGRADCFVHERKIGVKFDCSLIQGSAACGLPARKNLVPSVPVWRASSEALVAFSRGWLKSGQRFGRFPELSPEARGRRSQLMDNLITSANVGPFFRQGRS